MYLFLIQSIINGEGVDGRVNKKKEGKKKERKKKKKEKKKKEAVIESSIVCRIRRIFLKHAQ
jgi:hypothetical protein